MRDDELKATQTSLQEEQVKIERTQAEFQEASAKLTLARELVDRWSSNLTRHAKDLESAQELLHNATTSYVDGDYSRTVLIVQK
jgi:peptidoglycan hydrolase CwlO-like protein